MKKFKYFLIFFNYSNHILLYNLLGLHFHVMDSLTLTLYLLNYDKELYTLFRYGIEEIDYVNTPSGMELQNLYSYTQMSLKFENPFIKPKLAHDFSLWGEFMDGYLSAQVTDSGIIERYRNEQIMREKIRSLREKDIAFDEIIEKRINSYNNNIYKLYNGDGNAIYEFIYSLKPEEGKYIKDQIIQN